MYKGEAWEMHRAIVPAALPQKLTWLRCNKRPNPALSTPALFDTTVRLFVVVLASAAMSFSGIPHRPKPPTTLSAHTRARRKRIIIREDVCKRAVELNMIDPAGSGKSYRVCPLLMSFTASSAEATSLLTDRTVEANRTWRIFRRRMRWEKRIPKL